jgi:hypothetical protein
MRHSICGEVDLLVADAETEDEPSTREVVEHDGVLGEPHRMVEGTRKHRGAQTDRAAARREVREDEERRDRRAGATGLVELGEEDGIEAGPLGGPGLGGNLAQEGRDVATR